jgi:hypothetical protein
MPQHKSNKSRKCSSCGRRTKGHLGTPGKNCRMDELLLADNKSDTSESEEEVDEVDDLEKPLGAKVKVGAVLTVRAQLKLLSSQVSSLVGTVSKLVVPVSASVISEEALRAGLGASGERSKRSSAAAVDSGSSADGPTLKTLSRDRELSQLLKLYNQGDTEFLSSFDADKLQIPGPQGEKPRKHLSIPDFITRVEGSPKEDEGVYLSTAGGKLTFKAAGTKKVEVQNVCFGQWIGANSRIHEVLYSTMSPSQNAAYCEYTRMVGDLYQLYTESSVMVLDDEHRRMVALSGRSWADLSLHLERMHLKLKPVGSSVTSVASNVSSASGAAASVPSKSSSRKSNNPCYSYNSRAGCKTPDSCRYKHVCSDRVDGVTCRGAHPKYDHAKFHVPA